MSDPLGASERRISERRRARRAPTADESWFGAFESAEDTQIRPDESAPESPSTVTPEPADNPTTTLDSRLFSRQAERIVNAGQTAFERIFRTFIGARAALGVALVLAQAITSVFGSRPP